MIKSQHYLYAVNKYASLLVHPNHRNLGLSLNLTVNAQKLENSPIILNVTQKVWSSLKVFNW